MLDGMSDSIQRSRIENLHSKEVDRQSPTGLYLLHICSTIRLTSILINIQVATENTINFDISRYNYKHSNSL